MLDTCAKVVPEVVSWCQQLWDVQGWVVAGATKDGRVRLVVTIRGSVELEDLACNTKPGG